SPSMSLEIHPDSRQHLKGEMFSLRCSVRGVKREGWEQMRLRGTVVDTGCSQMEGRVTEESPEECILKNVSSRMSGLYWCRSVDGDQRSKAISVTVSGPWLGVVCAIVVILLLILLIFLLVPSLRTRIKSFPAKAPRVVSAQQEMPQTKQDVTEIQWDLAWMEMANLLDKQQYPGS
ncbi:hypothetical protein P4O66_009729, partial [Electrophorus voltai]